MYPLLWNRCKVIMGTSFYLVAVACSTPKASIDNAALHVADMAMESRSLAEDISVTTLEPETANKAGEIIGLQDDIIETSSDIRGHLHGVENTTPWWASMLQQGSIALIIIGVVVLLWQTGIGMFIKKLFWAMGWFIPDSAMRSAAVDLKASRDKHNLSMRETIAVRRSCDPAYEAARSKLKQESKK